MFAANFIIHDLEETVTAMTDKKKTIYYVGQPEKSESALFYLSEVNIAQSQGRFRWARDNVGKSSTYNKQINNNVRRSQSEGKKKKRNESCTVKYIYYQLANRSAQTSKKKNPASAQVFSELNGDCGWRRALTI